MASAGYLESLKKLSTNCVASLTQTSCTGVGVIDNSSLTITFIQQSFYNWFGLNFDNPEAIAAYLEENSPALQKV